MKKLQVVYILSTGTPWEIWGVYSTPEKAQIGKAELKSLYPDLTHFRCETIPVDLEDLEVPE